MRRTDRNQTVEKNWKKQKRRRLLKNSLNLPPVLCYTEYIIFYIKRLRDGEQHETGRKKPP